MTRQHRSLISLILLLAACLPDADCDSTPDQNDCAPNSPGGGQIDECDCPNNSRSPASCFENATEVESPTESPAELSPTPTAELCPDGNPPSAYYLDQDGDGYGVDIYFIQACDPLPYYTATVAGDCDDLDPSVHHNAAEDCDGVDDDCDGLADEGVTTTYFADEDADSFGNPNNTLGGCEPPSGYTDNADDCDDTDANNSPGGQESCDGQDNDCDGLSDEDDAFDAPTWYLDADGDGDGDPGAATLVDCDQPEGYVETDGDCDDGDASVSLDAPEIDCDGVDNDCDGVVIESEDCDGDHETNEGDCDDADANNSHLLPESCGDSKDNDCDFVVDEGCESATAPEPVTEPESTSSPEPTSEPDESETQAPSPTTPPELSSGTPDSTPTAAPATPTVPPSEESVTPTPVDLDGDGFNAATDCDDTTDLANPAAIEACDDGADQDCDGAIDESACGGAITCFDTGSELEVTVNGDVEAGLMNSLASTPTLLCIQSWDTGAVSCVPFIGNGEDHVFRVNLANFTPFAADSTSSEWFDLMEWQTSGDCRVAYDDVEPQGYVVEYIP